MLFFVCVINLFVTQINLYGVFMMEHKIIELHQKNGKQIRRISLNTSFIVDIVETKRGVLIRYSLRGEWSSLVCLSCVDCYDEVMRLIKGVN